MRTVSHPRDFTPHFTHSFIPTPTSNGRGMAAGNSGQEGDQSSWAPAQASLPLHVPPTPLRPRPRLLPGLRFPSPSSSKSPESRLPFRLSHEYPRPLDPARPRPAQTPRSTPVVFCSASDLHLIPPQAWRIPRGWVLSCLFSQRGCATSFAELRVCEKRGPPGPRGRPALPAELRRLGVEAAAVASSWCVLDT